MRKIYTSADQLIGKTPLLELVHIEKSEGLEARVLGKLEYFNPAGSVKDRIAMRSFTLPAGLKYSSLPSTLASRPSDFSMCTSSSSGVLPISWSADV